MRDAVGTLFSKDILNVSFDDRYEGTRRFEKLAFLSSDWVAHRPRHHHQAEQAEQAECMEPGMTSSAARRRSETTDPSANRCVRRTQRPAQTLS